VMRNVLKLHGTMLFGESSMHIGVRVSNSCSITARLPVSTLLAMKKLLFWKKILCSGNLILCRLAKCCDASKLMKLFVLVLHILKTAFGLIFLN